MVVHHKGRKKTTDSESGVAVGSVSQAAVEEKMTRKKEKELALDFYRFQKREAHRSGEWAPSPPIPFSINRDYLIRSEIFYPF